MSIRREKLLPLQEQEHKKSSSSSSVVVASFERSHY